MNSYIIFSAYSIDSRVAYLSSPERIGSLKVASVQDVVIIFVILLSIIIRVVKYWWIVFNLYGVGGGAFHAF